MQKKPLTVPLIWTATQQFNLPTVNCLPPEADARQSTVRENVIMEAEDYPFLRDVTRQRLVNICKALCVLQYSNLQSLYIRKTVIIIRSYELCAQ
jgi:hypothetical protein